MNSTPSHIGHYAQVSIQLDACDTILYEVNGVYEVTTGKKHSIPDVLQADVLAVCASSSLEKLARLLPKATLNHQWLSADWHALASLHKAFVIASVATYFTYLNRTRRVAISSLGPVHNSGVQT